MNLTLSDRKTVIIGSLISIAIITVAVGFAYQSYRIAVVNPLSDDATLSADMIQIASSVVGRVSAVHVRENDFVKKGDLLIEIDTKPYRLALEQARADLAIATAASHDQARNIRAEKANAVIAHEQVNRARVNLELASQTLDRLLPMEPKGYVSIQEVDDVRTLKRDAEVSLSEAFQQLEAAEAMIGNGEGVGAVIQARQAAVAIAEHELAGTKIYAPTGGRVVGLTTSVGNYILPAQTVFTLIDTSTWFASANYTETTLPRIAVGDCATVYALANRKVAISGKVDGIGWGVTSKDLISLPSVLPIVPKSLDWVRVQQRFPVRIRLIDPPSDLMRAGASAVAIVHNENNC